MRSLCFPSEVLGLLQMPSRAVALPLQTQLFVGSQLKEEEARPSRLGMRAQLFLQKGALALRRHVM